MRRRHGVLLHVLAHVDADHRPLVVEQEVGERAGQLGLADAGRAEEQERADRPVRVGQAGAAAADGVGHRGDRVVLADDPLVQHVLEADELVHLAFHEPADTGTPVHLATTSAMSSSSTSSFSICCVGLELVEARGRLVDLALELGHLCRSGSRPPSRGRPRARARPRLLPRAAP